MYLNKSEKDLVLSRKEWKLFHKMIQNGAFLERQGYIPYEISQATIIYDHCPRELRDLWKEFQFDHEWMIEALQEYSVKQVLAACSNAVEEVQLIRQMSGVDTKILEDCAEDLDNAKDQALTPQSIADRYITKQGRLL